MVSKTTFRKFVPERVGVYCKRPFGGPGQVIECLGRYTHKVAISNHRIRRVNEATVNFSYTDYRKDSKTKELTLSNQEFTRRFAQHILPPRYVRIRHYGLLNSHYVTAFDMS